MAAYARGGSHRAGARLFHDRRMRQVLQSLKTGEVLVQDVPVPATAERGVLVRAIATVVSAGTERMVVEFAEKNLLQKARARPDLVRQVLQKARREGLLRSRCKLGDTRLVLLYLVVLAVAAAYGIYVSFR